MLQTWPERVAAAVYVTVCLYALTRGSEVERRGAWIVGLAAIGTVLAQDRVDLLDPQRKLLIIDGLQFAAFVHLLLQRPVGWVTAATSLQALAMLTHVALLFSGDVGASAYLTAYMIWNYGVVLSLGVGAMLAHRKGTAEQASEPAAGA